MYSMCIKLLDRWVKEHYSYCTEKNGSWGVVHFTNMQLVYNIIDLYFSLNHD